MSRMLATTMHYLQAALAAVTVWSSQLDSMSKHILACEFLSERKKVYSIMIFTPSMAWSILVYANQ